MFAVDRTARWVVSGAHGPRLAAKYGTLHAATFNEGGREEVPSGSLRVAAAAAAKAAEWMDGLWDGRQSGAPHGYLRSRARAPLAARREH